MRRDAEAGGQRQQAEHATQLAALQAEHAAQLAALQVVQAAAQAQLQGLGEEAEQLRGRLSQVRQHSGRGSGCRPPLAAG